jgi:hypothetical protein
MWQDLSKVFWITIKIIAMVPFPTITGRGYTCQKISRYSVTIGTKSSFSSPERMLKFRAQLCHAFPSNWPGCLATWSQNFSLGPDTQHTTTLVFNFYNWQRRGKPSLQAKLYLPKSKMLQGYNVTYSRWMPIAFSFPHCVCGEGITTL